MYSLADGEARARAYPATFSIPPALRRYQVKPGWWVKLAFEDPENNHRGERMWVLVTKATKEGVYEGTLDNVPTHDWGLVWGDTVFFQAHNVLDILEP